MILLTFYNQLKIMRKNLSYYLQQFQDEIDLIERNNQAIRFDQYSDDLFFDSNGCSWPFDFQRPISDLNNTALPQLQIKPNISSSSAKQEAAQLQYKNLEIQAFQWQSFFHQFGKIDAPNLNLNTQLFHQAPRSRIKEQLKTFPNFIFRTFSRRLKEFQHLYSENDGLETLKQFFKDHYGEKHYTLEQVSKLFKDQAEWNCRLNRKVMYQILNRHNYTDIFFNSQRKNKKAYLIMSKVFKLRCSNANLCSRVQCE